LPCLFSPASEHSDDFRRKRVAVGGGDEDRSVNVGGADVAAPEGERALLDDGQDAGAGLKDARDFAHKRLRRLLQNAELVEHDHGIRRHLPENPDAEVIEDVEMKL
jgi:hypothetical protein